MPVFILLFSPELLCLALMLNVAPLTASGKDALDIVEAFYIWWQVGGGQRR